MILKLSRKCFAPNNETIPDLIALFVLFPTAKLTNVDTAIFKSAIASLSSLQQWRISASPCSLLSPSLSSSSSSSTSSSVPNLVASPSRTATSSSRAAQVESAWRSLTALPPKALESPSLRDRRTIWTKLRTRSSWPRGSTSRLTQRTLGISTPSRRRSTRLGISMCWWLIREFLCLQS